MMVLVSNVASSNTGLNIMNVSHKPRLHQDWIDSHAFHIVKTLQKAGLETYLVGGCVRDLLLGIHPKDYDIATIAQPKQIKSLVHNAYIIGRRFLLVLVKRDQQQYEIATFRRETKAEDFEEGEAPPGDNLFGTPEEDARRRDFTINGLFFDPMKNDLLDYVDGLADIATRTLRMIGDPDVRLIEDPIRILRALRLAHKLELVIDEALLTSMQKNAGSLATSILPRRREEILKFLRLKDPFAALAECYDLGVLENISPLLHRVFSDPELFEKFRFHFEHLRGLCHNEHEPIHLMSWMVISVVFAMSPNEIPSPEVVKEESFQNFMRNELGMFKLEQAFFTHTMRITEMLQKSSLLRKRGPKRLFSIMRDESFRFALKLCELNFDISPSDLTFWQDSYDAALPEIRSLAREKRPPRRRKRRTDPPTPQ